jgi:hypothetical protein
MNTQVANKQEFFMDISQRILELDLLEIMFDI